MDDTPLPISLQSSPKLIRIRVESQFGTFNLDARELHVEEEPDRYAVRLVVGDESAWNNGLDGISKPWNAPKPPDPDIQATS